MSSDSRSSCTARPSAHYDFGPDHPLTPRRFGPGIDLLRGLGRDALPGAAPRPPTTQLARLHDAPLHRARCARSRTIPSAAAHGHRPAATARRSTACTRPRRPSPAARSRRSSAILRRRGGARLQSAAAACTTRWPARASGFCIYNDVALGVAARSRRRPPRALRRPRRAPRRRHPGALLGRPAGADLLDPRERPDALPGHGLRRGDAAGRAPRAPPSTCPSRPYSGDGSWWPAVERIVPGARRGVPADLPGHAARLRQPRLGPARAPAGHDRGLSRARRACSTRSRTTTARAAGWRPAAAATTRTGSCRARGRSSGWRRRTARCPRETPAAWRERWAAEADRHGQGPPPAAFVDPPDLVPPETEGFRSANRRTLERSLERASSLLAARG